MDAKLVTAAVRIKLTLSRMSSKNSKKRYGLIQDLGRLIDRMDPEEMMQYEKRIA